MYEINVPKMICKNAELYTSYEAESRYSLGASVRLDSACIRYLFTKLQKSKEGELTEEQLKRYRIDYINADL